MTPQELHLSILELAFQGRLTEHMQEDGTGAELLDIIKAEKLRLTKAKLIKKEKELPAIAEDDAHFDIPETWIWAYVGDIFLHNTGKAQNSSGSENGVVRKFITTSNLYWNRFDFSKVKEMPFTEKELERCTVKKGDLLVCEGGDCGRSAIWNYDEEVCIQNHVHRLRPYVDISIEYFYHLFYLYKFTGKLRGRGVGIQGLSNEAIHQVICPLPPVAEQKRIVAKIEELLPLIDRYEQAWSRLEDFNKRFPVDMQKSILQMAIQGKLVPQLSEEGTGEELYQQIQTEKQRLIKAGTIKKEKPLPEITEDEIPFDIPDTWTWERLGDISWYFDAGKSPNCLKQPVTGDEWGVITTTAVQLGYFDEVQNKILPKDFKVNTDIQVHSGDILITRAGPTNRTGIACLVKEIRYNLILSDKIIRINMSNRFIHKDYIIMVLNSPQIRNMIVGLMSGMDKQQVNVSQDKYKTLLIPLPPIAEQKRIVGKLEEILPLCERLK